MNNKLLRKSIPTLILSLSCLFIKPPAANSQSTNYFCQSYQQGYATLGRSSLGFRSIIIWDNRQALCNTVSTRFQAARDNGNLRFLVKEENRVCGTDRIGGDCKSLLFATNTEINADVLWRRIRANIPISLPESTYIAQANGREYFNLELYLNTAPASFSNQVFLENQ